MALSTEKKKQIAAIALACLMVATFAYTFFFSDDSPKSSAKNGAATQQKKVVPGINAPVTAANPAPQQNPQITLISQPLELGGLGGAASPVIGRNVFIYPPPPPPPTPKPIPTPTPAPPPPITLGGMDPSSRIARTAEFDMKVFGAKIPADAQVLINGAPIPTSFVNEQQVSAKIPAYVIANPGAVQVEVKSAADPAKWYSNRLTFNIAAPPVPQYKYLGIIVKNGTSTAYIRDESDSELQAVKKGQKLGSRWEVTGVTPSEIEITDTQNKIKHRIALNGEGS